jgi:hypothetical protein
LKGKTNDCEKGATFYALCPLPFLLWSRWV